MKKHRLSVSTVNSAIARAGIKAQLVRGQGYFYFTGQAVELAYSTSVPVHKITQLTEAQWLEELRAIAEASSSRLRDAQAHEVELQ